MDMKFQLLRVVTFIYLWQMGLDKDQYNKRLPGIILTFLYS